MSTFTRVPDLPDRLDRLRQDLATGAWRRAHGDLLARDACDLGYRLVTAEVSCGRCPAFPVSRRRHTGRAAAASG